jgi:hypothetical protein
MIISVFLDVLMVVTSMKNHGQVDCILSVIKLPIRFNQTCDFSILTLVSEVTDFIIQYCDGLLKTCCDCISQVNAGVAEVLMQCWSVGVTPVIIPPLLVLLFRSFIKDTTKS